MSLRIRSDGRILCAASHPELPGDTYLDDRIHENLCSVGAIVTEAMDESGGRGGHAAHGEWWWRDRVPPDVVPAPGFSGHWPGEICKRCLRRNVVGFDVPDTLWESVAKGRWTLLCPGCFDEVAEEEGVAYDIRQADLYPVSWSGWKRAEVAA